MPVILWNSCLFFCRREFSPFPLPAHLTWLLLPPQKIAEIRGNKKRKYSIWYLGDRGIDLFLLSSNQLVCANLCTWSAGFLYWAAYSATQKGSRQDLSLLSFSTSSFNPFLLQWVPRREKKKKRFWRSEFAGERWSGKKWAGKELQLLCSPLSFASNIAILRNRIWRSTFSLSPPPPPPSA